MKKKIAILGYDTINIGDDIQSFVTSTLVDPDYVIVRDNYDEIYNFKTGEKVDQLEEEVVLIMNGWFMHSPDRKYSLSGLKFPIKNKKITPLFISTCLAKEVPELMSLENIKWYRENSPFLCRDMYTKKNLDNFQVDNDFYGCMTQLLTIDSVGDNPEYKKLYSDSVFYVDCSAQEDIKEKHFFSNHYRHELVNKNPIDRMKMARDLLQKYRYAKKIYTSRLHCFLPCRAMGLNVEYVGRVDWRTQDLVLNLPKIEEMKKVFYENLEKKLRG